MILTEIVKIRIWGTNIKHLQSLGYDNLKINNFIEIPVEHLAKKSNKKVKCKCDICGKEKEIPYIKYLKNISKYNIYSCSSKCSRFKQRKTSFEKYGNENYNNMDKNKQTKLKNHGDENYHNIEQMKITNLERHGDENYNNMEQMKKTNLKNHGNENYNNREQSKETCLKEYGVENVSQSEKNKNKKKNTCLKNHGVEHPLQSPEIQDKIKQTNLKKYDVEHPMQNEKIKEKTRQTNLKRFGTEHPMQNTEHYNKVHKNGFRFKDYILPSGKVVKIQGYENLALDVLLKKYKEDDLIIENKDIENYINKIWFINDIGKKRRYYPDIYIISENKIIEVKSEWTFKRDKEKNLLKEQACLNMGMDFEFIVFNNKKQLLSKDEVKKLI